MFRVGKLFCSLLPLLAFVAMVSLMPSAARATIYVTGDVSPSDPSTWPGAIVTVGAGTVTIDSVGTATTATTDYLSINGIPTGVGTVIVTGTGASWNATGVAVGSGTGTGGSNVGTLSVLNGGAMIVSGGADSRIGYFGGIGTVTVDGGTYANAVNLLLGTGGTGTMNISNGGSVSVAQDTYVAILGTATTNGVGSINFGAGGGSLSTRTLLAAPASLTGTGTIATNGVVTDGTITFNNNANKLASFTANGTVGVTVNMNTDANNGYLGAGYSGTGSLTISNGVTISTQSGYFYDGVTETNPGGYLGYNAGASGTATVQDGSTLATTGQFYVGYRGAGTLNIQNGSTFGGTGCDIVVAASLGSSGAMNVTSSTVTSNSIIIAGYTDGAATGVATFDNATVTTGRLYCGDAAGATGTLNIRNGSVMNMTGYQATIGLYGAGTGTVNVDAATLNIGGTNCYGIVVGGNGIGTVNITNGGAVNVTSYRTNVNTTNGTIHFGAGGGTLTAKNLVAAPTTLTGTGTVVAHGILTDGAFTFDSPGSLTQSHTANESVTLTLDLATPANNGFLGLGLASGSTGSIMVSNGATIHTSGAYLGYNPGSSVTATVKDGATWSTDNGAGAPYDTNNFDPFYVGFQGSATLRIENGGIVGSSVAGASSILIGYYTDTSGTVPVISSGTVTVTGLGSKLLNGTSGGDLGGLVVGVGGHGRLDILDQANVTTVATNIGLRGVNGVGVVNLDGIGTTWTSSGSFYIGQGGNGTLHITNGAVLTTGGGMVTATAIGTNPSLYSTNGTGSVTVDGLGSKWTNNAQKELSIGGNGGGGRLSITNGGLVSNKCNISIANNGTLPGIGSSVSVDGVGSDGTTHSSLTTTKALYVGLNGTGSLSITNGGSVSAGTAATGSNIYIAGAIGSFSNGTASGYAPTGSVTVDGANSRLVAGTNSSIYMYLGYNGAGSLTISNGGAVSNNTCYMAGYGTNGWGYAINLGGTVSISGSASTWTSSGTVNVGYYGPGVINLDGGTIFANTLKSSAGSGTASMIINFNGGTLKPYSTAASTWIQTGLGTSNLYVKEGGAKFDTNGSSPTIALALQHSGTATVDGGVTKLGTGTLTLSGINTYTGWTGVSGGVLSLTRADGLYHASNAHIDLGAALNLGFTGSDTVHYAFFDGLPVAAATYSAGTSSGGHITGTGSLVVTGTALQGDLDLNGTVNSTDLGALLSHYNQTFAGFDWAMGDVDGNHTVNSTDLGLLLSNYNKVSAATSAVPEPSTLLLAAAGLIGLLAYAWRKRK